MVVSTARWLLRAYIIIVVSSLTNTSHVHILDYTRVDNPKGDVKCSHCV